MYRGNRWYKCDFHLHTPASKCFKNQEVTAKQFIEEVVKKGLDCIAITDHNTAAGINEIREIGQENGITVFPGVEVTCGEVKAHILVIFDVDYKIEEIEYFLRIIGINPSDFGKDTAHSPKTVKEVIETAIERGGVVIPAHVDERATIATISNSLREELLKSQDISAVQMVNKEFICDIEEQGISKEELKQLYTYLTDENINDYLNTAKTIKKLKKAIMTFSDNPDQEFSTKHGLWGIGNQYTWIKMGEKPNLNSLKQALLMPNERIKNCVLSSSIPYKMPGLWVEKIEIENINTINELLTTSYSPQLTTIIGGRGSGKSTTIRLLTGIFNRDRIKEIGHLCDEFNNFYKIGGDGGGVLQPETIIKTYIMKNGIRYRITTKYEGSSIRLVNTVSKIEKDVDGEYEVVNNVKPEELFKLDIYNQKQIYEMAQNPNVLKEKIDTLAPEIDEIKQNLIQLKDQYITKYQQVVGIHNRLKNKKKIELDIQDIQEKINFFHKLGIKDILKEYQDYDKQYQALRRFLGELEHKNEILLKFMEEFNLNVPDSLVVQEVYRKEIEEFTEIKSQEFNNFKSELISKGNQLENIISNFKKQVIRLEWYQKALETKEEYQAALKVLEEKNVDIKEIDLLISQLQQKQEGLEELVKLERSLEQEYNMLDQIKKEYCEKFQKLRDLRNDCLIKLLDKSNVRVRLVQNRDKSTLEKQLRMVLNREQNYKEDFKKIIDFCLSGDVTKTIEALKADFLRVRQGKESLIEYSSRFIGVLKELNDEQIARIELFIPEDDVKVEYKKNGSETFTSLTNASAGQRTSAILTFILSDGTTPLILDQPEDDLDNHLIYDLIVERLKKCKDERQIIVVTHNANVPVNGDAELIIGMDSKSKAIRVDKIGTIEEESIKEEICNVMEGGESAFKMRAQKYGLVR